MVILAVTWMANSGNEKAVVEIFRKLQTASRKEPGCLMYIVHQHRSDPRRFFVYEQYQDDEALNQHRQSPHFQEYAASLLPRLAERLQGDLYVLLAERSST
jgi:quinol monooxygenase YgiN